MKALPLAKKASFYYLAIMPFLAAAIGFGVGHSPAGIYIPIWTIHTCLAILLLRNIRGLNNNDKSLLPWYMLVFPWLLFSIFAGFGPPPQSAQAWVASAGEQQIRYLILVAGGVCAALGFWLLKDVMVTTAGARLSTIAVGLVSISLPLFVINMLYWGFFLTASFQSFVSKGTASRPDWYIALRDLFYWVASVQLALFYLATALLAMAFKLSGLLRALPCYIYFGISLFAVLCSVLPMDVAAPLNTVAYITAVPAIGFIMPYLMGLNLIYKNSQR